VVSLNVKYGFSVTWDLMSFVSSLCNDMLLMVGLVCKLSKCIGVMIPLSTFRS
jgi:hypothetical protein